MTGYLAINKALESLNTMNTIDNSQLVLIQFKVNSQGVFISDLNRKKFLRNHFPTETVTFCAIDDRRIWPNKIGKIEQPR
jgi:tensin